MCAPGGALAGAAPASVQNNKESYILRSVHGAEARTLRYLA